MKVKLVSLTNGAGDLSGILPEGLISHAARVSNPSNQMNLETAPKLIKYLIDHKHWSPFEMVSMCVEIKTSRAIAAQILRHKSFSFQEFSQRYSSAQTYVKYPARRQDVKNRQNSIDDMDKEDMEWFDKIQEENWDKSFSDYKQGLARGIAKEQMRFILPLSTETTLYMSGTVRSFIHYLDIRSDKSTQLEHREIALEVKEIFKQQFPAIAEAKGWL